MAEPHAVGLESLDGLLRKADRFTEKGEFSSMAGRLCIKVHLHDLMESLKKIQDLLSAADQTQISASAALKEWFKRVNELNATADDLLDRFAYEARRLGAVKRLQDKKKRNKVCNFFSGCNSSVITRRKVICGFRLVSSRYRDLAHEAHKFGLDLPERPVDATAQFAQILQTTDSSVVESHIFEGGDDSVALQPEEYYWELFRQIAFAPGGPDETPRLKEMGEAIVRRCRRHLLAIKTIGGLLYTKKYEEEWMSIERSEKWDIGPIFGPLLLSYIHLPSISLKQCFIYCSIFPRGSVMEKDELIQLWNAQGLLNPSQGSDLSEEALGAKYLAILVRTSFLENAEQDEVDRRKSDRRKFYKMHDRLHDLASSLSKGQCSIMEGIDIEANDLKLAAHMSLINCEREILKSVRGKEKLRTLRLVNSRVFGETLVCTTSLRVLIVVDWHVDELPDSVSKLKLLHYLDISKTKILKLPDSISVLYNLQTLKLYDLIEPPKNFENLVSLRHLYIERFKDLDRLRTLPPQFRNVINPSSSKAYLHSKCSIEKLLESPDLCYRLSIYCLENVNGYEEAKKAKLSSMSTIECLRLHWNARRENKNDEGVLEGLEPHANIKNLAIENYKGSAFPLWMGKTTQQLTLDQLAEMEKTGQPLTLDQLVEMKKTGQLRIIDQLVEMENTPTLNQLVKMELEDCSCCEQVPPLGHLPNLKIVKIQGMVNVKSIGAEFYGYTNGHDQCSTSSSASRVFLQLRELTLREMTSLEEWSEPANLSNDSSSVCPLLEKFEVEQCPKLKCLPNVMTTSHRLRRLEVAMCDSLECLPEGVGGLESLEDLDIRGLPSLSQLSIGCFDNLKTLTIGGFSSAPEVDCNGEQTSLHLKGGDGNVASLPVQLQYLSALRFLTISGYGGLETLPVWISSLRSLQILKLEFCWKLAHFPASEKMQQLEKLEEVDICYCPLLEARCTKGSRPELYKISHIPRIMINSEEIKFRLQNKNKNTTNTQTRRNEEKDIEESGNQERNEGEGEQHGRSAASSSSQPDQGMNIHASVAVQVEFFRN